MDLDESPELRAFRREAREWLAGNLPPGFGEPGYRGPADPVERVEVARAWQKSLHRGGFAGLAWPREYGGRGAGILEQLVWSEELARAWAPDLILLAVGIDLVGPVLIAKGKPWQRERFLPKILAGEEIWCQGFSEPGAGSDLASLETRGEPDGDEIVVTGRKLWTSFAHFSDWCILVVRTDPGAAKKHAGLSFLLVDMRSPGIEVRPLRSLTGEDWFNEVRFEAVRVPVENVVGEVNKGWEVVLETLSTERVAAAPHARLEAELALLCQLARRVPWGDGVAADDPRLRQRLAGLRCEVLALRLGAYRNAQSMITTGLPGPQASLFKLGWSELDQRLKQLACEILGPHGLLLGDDERAVENGHWSYQLLWTRGVTIYAGTSEVQRNIISERVLGLPRA